MTVSTTINVTIRCDVCQDSNRTVEKVFNQDAAIQLAREAGWFQTTGGLWVCPRCCTLIERASALEHLIEQMVAEKGDGRSDA